jgi:ubiquinone biosynthesis protein
MTTVFRSTWRLIKAGHLLLRHDALIPKEASAHLSPGLKSFADILRLIFAKKPVKGERPLRAGERYAMAFESLGPAFIKLGQVISTRTDIFGNVFTEDLRRLKDQLPPFSVAQARKIVEAALEQPIDSIFSNFGGVIGAASIAQAHKATLLDGRVVAVKILRPNIDQIIASDIAMLRLAAKIITTLSPAARRLEPEAFTEAVAVSLSLEIDLRLEASAADELGAIINIEPYMQVPKIVWQYVAKRVLVMEWAKGQPLSKPETLDIIGLDRLGLADNLIRAFLSQALNHGVFHADLHEGNLFVDAPAKIVAIDFGIIGRLQPKERRYLAEMLWGFLRRDYKRVAEVHFEAGYVPRHHNVDSFAQALRAVGEPVLGLRATEVSMGRLLTQLFEITAQFDMHLRPELVLLQKTMVSVEGVARRLYPEHNLWDAAKPVVEAWIRRELSPLNEAKRLFERLIDRLNIDEGPKPDNAHELMQLQLKLKDAQGLSLMALGVSVVSLLAIGYLIWV